MSSAIDLDGTARRLCLQMRDGKRNCSFGGAYGSRRNDALRTVIGGQVPERRRMPLDDVYNPDDHRPGHLCTIDADGHVQCSGEHWQGTFVDLDASHDQTCALRIDGRVLCQKLSRVLWSATLVGPDVVLTKIAVGDGFVCGLDPAGHALCWGGTSQLQDTLPTGARFRSLSAGNSHACGVTLEGKTSCWGNGFYGQTKVPPDAIFEEVVAIDDHSCGITGDDVVSCWGSREAEPAAR